MLIIATALYCEAQPFIEYYQLKKDTAVNRFQVFQGKEIKLIITKPGSVPAAIGAAYLCSLNPPGASDFFLNVGVCGLSRKAEQTAEKGSICICNKITDRNTKKSYYPDILFPHPFHEGSILTCPFVMTTEEEEKENKGKLTENLFDMEAAGLYQAASVFFRPHQMAFLKVVSDYGGGEVLPPQEVAELIRSRVPMIAEWLEHRNHLKFRNEPVFSEAEERLIHTLSEKLFCSVTMEHQLRQLLQYHKLVRGNLKELDRILTSLPLPCKSKTEGKRHFELLKTELVP